MATRIRIGEDKHIRATLTDQEGGRAFFANAGYSNDGPDFAAISFLEEEGGDSGNTHAIVSGEGPGTAVMDFDAVDSFFDNVSAQETFVVVDAVAFELILKPVAGVGLVVTKTGYKVRLTESVTPEIAAELVPIDEFGAGEHNGVPAPLAFYASGLTNVEWESVNGLFLFDTGGGPGPGPISDVLTLTLVPNAGGDDILRVSGTNFSGDPITQDFAFRILNASQVGLAVTEE
jgi:hypothetical protein